MRRPAAGMGQACCARWRWSRATDASSRRHSGLWWCMRATWRSSKPKRIPLRQRRKPQPWQPTCSMSTRSGLRVRRMPQRRSRSMNTGGRAGEAAGPSPGGIMRYAIAGRPRRTRRARRARRGRPAKTAPPPTEAGYRLMVEVEALANPGGGQWLDRAGHHRRGGGLYRCGDSRGVSGATHAGGPRLSLEQASGGARSRVAGETRTDCRLGAAHRRRLTGLQGDPETGPPVSTHA